MPSRRQVQVRLAPVRPAEVAAHQGDVDLAALARVGPMDTHAHVFQDVPAYYEFMKQINLRIVDICVLSRKDEPPYDTQAAQFHMAMTVHKHSDGRAGVCTTFDP